MNIKINIVDIECTCWIDEPQPDGQIQEIIEIGIAQLNLKTLEIDRSDGIIVTPTISTLSDSCTKLTSITSELIESEGISFENALLKLEDDYNSKYSFWGSYGYFDMRVFSDQCAIWGANYPFCPQHVNVKAFIRSVYPNVRGLASALRKMGMTFEGTEHRGVDDAKNIALLYAEILKRFRNDESIV